jgi:hypothetical protein
MLKNPGGESQQIFTDTVLDQVPDRMTALSRASSHPERSA